MEDRGNTVKSGGSSLRVRLSGGEGLADVSDADELPNEIDFGAAERFQREQDRKIDPESHRGLQHPVQPKAGAGQDDLGDQHDGAAEDRFEKDRGIRILQDRPIEDEQIREQDHEFGDERGYGGADPSVAGSGLRIRDHKIIQSHVHDEGDESDPRQLFLLIAGDKGCSEYHVNVKQDQSDSEELQIDHRWSVASEAE